MGGGGGHRTVLKITQEAETGRSKVQGHPTLQSNFKTSLTNLMRPCLEIKNGAWECGSKVESSTCLESPSEGLGYDSVVELLPPA